MLGGGEITRRKATRRSRVLPSSQFPRLREFRRSRGTPHIGRLYLWRLAASVCAGRRMVSFWRPDPILPDCSIHARLIGACERVGVG